MKFNINTDAAVVFTNKLEKLSRSAFPVAVRGTLNDAAFDLKTRSMPEKSEIFKKREPNFFKANSKFISAMGFNLNTMRSDVGFYENKLKNASTNYAIKDLEQQEEGGVIKRKSFIASKKARKGSKGNVKANARLSAIKKIANRSGAKGSNWGQQMIKSAIHVGVGGFLLTEQFQSYNGGALFRIKSIKRHGRNTRFVADFLHSFKKGRTVNVESKHFMRSASLITASRMDEFYYLQALRQFKKAGILK